MTDTSIKVEAAAAGSVVTAVLELVRELMPFLGASASSTVGTVLSALEAIVPLLVGAVPEIVEEVKAVIADLKASGAATADQIARADALASAVDAAWNDALSTYNANHPTGA